MYKPVAADYFLGHHIVFRSNMTASFHQQHQQQNIIGHAIICSVYYSVMYITTTSTCLYKCQR